MNATLTNEINATKSAAKQSSLRILRVREGSEVGSSAACMAKEMACCVKVQNKGKESYCFCKLQG